MAPLQWLRAMGNIYPENNYLFHHTPVLLCRTTFQPHFLSCGAASIETAFRWHHRPPWEPLTSPWDPSQPPPGPLTAPDRLFGSNDTSRRAMATTATTDTAPCLDPFPAPRQPDTWLQIPAPPDSQILSNWRISFCRGNLKICIGALTALLISMQQMCSICTKYS